MSLITVTDRERWDAFMASQPRSQFTQSWAWGDFRVSRGQAVERLALVKQDGVWEAAGLFTHLAKPLIGGYWYAPRGPVVGQEALDAGEGSSVMTRFIDALKRRGLSRPSVFWRIEPPVAASAFRFEAVGASVSHAYMPASTLLIDLAQSEEELLKAMHEKTRYNIRLSERHDVTVRQATEVDAIETFLKLNDETATRDGFVSQPAAYIRATYDALSKQGMAHLRFAEKDGVALAASLEMSFGDTTTYLYGASSSQARNVMAPYALHWQAIRAAKESGKRFYDFHGLNPLDASSRYYKKTWEGITRFKRGWGGDQVDYVGTGEIPRQTFAYALLRLLRRIAH